LFLLCHGWVKQENMPKYVKQERVVNVKFMQDLIAIVAEVEQTDSHEVVLMIREYAQHG